MTDESAEPTGATLVGHILTEDQRTRAWGFPNPIFEKLAEMFPSLRFECTCFDESWDFAGHGAFNGDPPFKLVEPTGPHSQFTYKIALCCASRASPSRSVT